MRSREQLVPEWFWRYAMAAGLDATLENHNRLTEVQQAYDACQMGFNEEEAIAQVIHNRRST